MTDFEGRRKGGPGKKKETVKKVRREDLTEEGKKLYDDEKAYDARIWEKEARERIDAKLKKLMDDKSGDKSESEKKLDELINAHREKSIQAKIRELDEKLNPPKEPDHIIEFKAAKRRLEQDDVMRQTDLINKELAKRMNPPKDDPLDVEYKEYMEKNAKYEKILRNEQLKKQIKQKVEMIEDKAKYLSESGGGFFSNLFGTNKSKNLTGGGLMALGLMMGMFTIVGLVPLFLGGGILLSESGESKAKKATK